MARDLKMPVARLLEQVDLDEFAQWKALYTVEREQDPWTRQEALLAGLLEEVSAGLLRLAYLQAGKKVGIPDRPMRVERPGETRAEGVSDAAKAMALMKQLGGG